MTFSVTPMFGGDLNDVAVKLAREASERIATAEDANERAALYASTWKQAAELGWCGVLIPEEQGGTGGSMRELAALVEGVARYALPLPISDMCGIIPALFAGARSAADTRFAQLVAAGEYRVAPILKFAGLECRREGGALIVNGMAQGLDVTGDPTHFALVAGAAKSHPRGIVLIPSMAQGLGKTRFEGMDGRRTVDVKAENCRLEATALIESDETADEMLERALLVGSALSCVTAVSAIGALLEETIQYLGVRVQFGKPLSEFQVLRHKVVEIYVGYENLKALVTALINEAEFSSHDWRLQVSLAKLYAGELSRFAAHAAIQLHGAIGMTQELLAARLAVRLLMLEFEYGDRHEHLVRTAAAKGRKVH